MSKRSGRFWKRASLAGAALVLVLAAWQARPIYHRIAASRIASAAERAAAQNQYGEAVRLFELALQKNPRSATTARSYAALLDRIGWPELVEARARVSQLEPKNIAARLDHAEAALRFDDRALARRLLMREVEGGKIREEPRFYHLVSVLHLKSGEVPEAEMACARALKRAPTNKLFQAQQAAIRLRSDNPAARAEAIGTLDRLAEDPRASFDAWRSLLERAASAPKAPPRLDAWLDGYRRLVPPGSVFFSDYLDALRRWRPLQFEAELRTHLRVAGESPRAATRAQRWLVQAGLHEEALRFRDTLDPSGAADPDRLGLTLESLVALKRLEAAEQILGASSWDTQPAIKAAWQERLRRTKRGPVDSAAWKRVLKAATDNAEALRELARLSKAWGWRAEYEQTLWVLAAVPAGDTTDALGELFRLYVAAKDTDGALRVVRRQVEIAPENPSSRSNLAFLSFLLEVDPTRARQVAEELCERHPTTSTFVATRAFGAFKAGEIADGLIFYEKLDRERLKGTASGICYGLLLAEIGDEAAAEFLEEAERWIHFPEEERLVAEARRKIQENRAQPLPSPGEREEAAHQRR